MYLPIHLSIHLFTRLPACMPSAHEWLLRISTHSKLEGGTASTADVRGRESNKLPCECVVKKASLHIYLPRAWGGVAFVRQVPPVFCHLPCCCHGRQIESVGGNPPPDVWVGVIGLPDKQVESGVKRGSRPFAFYHMSRPPSGTVLLGLSFAPDPMLLPASLAHRHGTGVE